MSRSARRGTGVRGPRKISRVPGKIPRALDVGPHKEVVANLLHHQSRRRARPFVPVSCALFSEGLIESELFGHERGAFTGAIKDRPGRFELAQGGTVFLDDVRELENACELMAQTNTCGEIRVGCVAARVLFDSSDAAQAAAIERVAGPAECETSSPEASPATHERRREWPVADSRLLVAPPAAGHPLSRFSASGVHASGSRPAA